MDNRRERKTSGESTASDSSETASCRPYYQLPETPADCSSSQVVRSAIPSTWYAPGRASTSRVGDYSQSPSDLIDFHRSNQPCSSYYPLPRLPLSVTVPTQSNSVSNSTPLNKSGEDKRRLSPSWSTPDPKLAKLAQVDKTVAYKEGKPDDCELDDLAGKICSKWQELGLRLGISQNKLDEIDANEKRKAYRMLLHWRNTTASTVLYRDLYVALCHHRVGLNNVAKEFCVTDSGASAEEMFDVKCCRSKLAEHYKKTATVPTSVWSKKCLVDIHQIYTRLSWVKEEQTPAGSSQCELKHYTDVFNANKNGVVPKRILVQGQTGIGKSTFVKKLAVDWAELDDTTTEDKQKDILKTFELLVVVNLKEVSKCQSLKDVISRSPIFAREEKHLTYGLLNYITNNQEKVLLVFDGYDEYRCGRNSEIYEIFSGNELRNCCVLITTRISKADELQAFKDLHAEITGFGEEDREAFMSRMLRDKAEVKELIFHLALENLEDLAKVPLLLLFFCTLWKKGKSKGFPNTKTKLYLAIVQYVLDHNQRKDSPARFGKVDDFKEVLVEIGKVALECLLKDDHVFEYDQFSDAVLCDESFVVGLLQVTEYAENLRPAGMVSFIHKSIQEFLVAWFVTYRCVPEGNLGGIEQHTRTLEDCRAWENVFQFVCGLSDNGAVKVFQHFTSVRVSDPRLDLSKTIPDEENEADVPLSEVTPRHEEFSDLVYGFFVEVQSKAKLVTHWLDCTAGIILITPQRPFPKDILKMTLAYEVASFKALYFYPSRDMSNLYEFQEFVDCLHVPLRMTENSAAALVRDFLRQFKTVRCEFCYFGCVFRFHNGKAQFYITELLLYCDHHARLFIETFTISTPSRSANFCLKQSCLKFLRSFNYFGVICAEDLGAVMRNCKHLKTIGLDLCRDGVCELLDQVPNPSTCSLNLGCVLGHDNYLPTVVKAHEKVAGFLPRFNDTALHLDLGVCCVEAVNILCSFTHQSLDKLTLRSIGRTQLPALGLGRLLPEMSSLGELELSGVDGSILQAKEMEALFGGIDKTLPSLQFLSLEDFNARGSLAPLTKRFQFFPNLSSLYLWNLNMDEHDLHGLLESLTSCPNLKSLSLNLNPLGSKDRLESIVKQALPQITLYY